ncbi:hypothetical protein HYX03_00335 [Candidatus Woesearchaeota archaeon]|nr:hypothetical protein [Candidatus Woesearchaeota archaeon]
MKIIIFALLFAVLTAAVSFAEGLEITKIDAHADYDYSTVYQMEREQKTTKVDNAPVPLINGSSIKIDVFPGSNLTFTLTIENTFKDMDLRDIDAKITIEGRHGKKWKELSRSFVLEAGREEKADVKFYVPYEIDTGPHDVLIEVQGTGKNDTAYASKLTSRLDIRKLSHDIKLTNASLEPSTVDCKRKAQLSAEIANGGSSVENEVALEFKSSSLGIDSYDKGIFLGAFSDDDTDYPITHKKTLNIEVPSFFKSGTYPISVNLYWQNFILFDQKTLYLTVEDCTSGAAKAKPAQETRNETSINVIQPAEETKIPPQGLITMTEEVSILDSPVLYLMLLGGVSVIVLLAALVVFGLPKKS